MPLCDATNNRPKAVRYRRSRRDCRTRFNTDRSDLYYLVEALYKTDDGEYFLHGAGGAATKYATSHSNGKSGGEEITVLSEDDAVDWCEDHSIDAEIILEEFGHLIES